MTLLSANQIAYIFRANDKKEYCQCSRVLFHILQEVKFNSISF